MSAVDPQGDDEIVIRVSRKSSLARHVEELQRVLTKRNARIAELEEENRVLREGRLTEPEIAAAREQGRREAYNEVESSIRESATALNRAADAVWRKSREH